MGEVGQLMRSGVGTPSEEGFRVSRALGRGGENRNSGLNTVEEPGDLTRTVPWIVGPCLDERPAGRPGR